MTTLTDYSTTLTTVVSRLTIITADLQSQFTELMGVEASTIQIMSGSFATTEAIEASTTYLVVLRAITVTQLAVSQVETMLTTLVSSSSSSQGMSGMLTGEEFLARLQLFLEVLESDIISTAATTLSLELTNVLVTLTEEEKTLVMEKQAALSLVSSEISQAISFYSAQFETLTGEAVSQTQILAGDPTTAIDTVAVGNEMDLETMSENALSAERTGMLCGRIAEDPIKATASGTVDMEVMELCGLVQELYDLISQDFLYAGGIAILMVKIESGRLSRQLTVEETTMVVNTVARLESLSINIRTSMKVVNNQYLAMTGIEYIIETKEVMVKESAEIIAANLLVEMKALQMSSKVSNKWCFSFLAFLKNYTNFDIF